MRHSLAKRLLVLAILVPLLIGVPFLICCRYSNRKPHLDPVHPPEVLRILELLPSVPENASPAEVMETLALPTKPSGGLGYGIHYELWWDISPGYTFSFSYAHGRRQGGGSEFELLEAGISRKGPDGEWRTVYPLRRREGMVSE